MQDVRLMGRYDPSSLAGFLAFSRGMMIAKSQIPGHFPELKDWLKMARSSALPCGPSAFRNEGGCRLDLRRLSFALHGLPAQARTSRNPGMS